MALISCPECRREISEDAVSCPHCGFPLAKISGSAGDVVVVRRGFALAAVILATGYLVFSALFYIGNFAPYTGISWLGDMFANSLYIHVVLLAVGVIFGWSGFLTQRRNQVLTSAILYCVAAVFFLLWLLFLVLPIVFGFVGYARMRPIRVRADDSLPL